MQNLQIFSRKILDELAMKIRSAFSRYQYRCPEEILRSDANHQYNAIEQVELMLNRFADYLIKHATSLPVPARVGLVQAYSDYCREYEKAISQFTAEVNGQLDVDDERSSVSSSTLSDYDMEDYDACNDMSLDASPSTSPEANSPIAGSPVKSRQTNYRTARSISSAGEAYFQQQLHGATAPPASRTGSPAFGSSTSSTTSQARRRLFAADDTDNPFHPPAPAPSSTSLLYPVIVEYAKDLRLLYRTMCDLANSIELNSNITVVDGNSQRNIPICDCPVWSARTRTYDTLQKGLQHISAQLAAESILPKNGLQVLSLADHLCALRLHLVIHYYFADEASVKSAVKIINLQLQQLKQRFPQYGREMQANEMQYNDIAQKADYFTEQLYQLASREFLKQHDKNIVVPLKNAKNGQLFAIYHIELGFIHDWHTCHTKNKPPVLMSDRGKWGITAKRMQKAGINYRVEDVPKLTSQQRFTAMVQYIDHIINKLPVDLDQREVVEGVYRALQRECGLEHAEARRQEILANFGLTSVVTLKQHVAELFPV